MKVFLVEEQYGSAPGDRDIIAVCASREAAERRVQKRIVLVREQKQWDWQTDYTVKDFSIQEFEVEE